MSTTRVLPRRRRALRRRAVALAVVALLALVAFAAARGGPAPTVPGVTTTAHHGVGAADGFVPVGASLSPSDDVPAITRLDPALLAAVRRAADDARADGIELRIASGWRSRAYQRRLFDQAVRRYGDRDAARRFVKPPGESSHVVGRAVDIGPTDAAYWTIQHGSAYGLCQTYANEVWHFERTVAPGGTCPPPRTDAAGG
ncbi:M15 family metallopeptidase [Patulibacter sp. SYSU D01012]|uniref:M15 family metallopeptidase n=1 Tax=Patulibacter sp. SYSU D01012 TaxID=2817381 RepID=UPI001B3076E5|nr:M15 family metallopeptidase [Patulibacter sp. SYSU D01012]